MGYIRKNPDTEKYTIFRKNPIPEFLIIPVYSSEQFWNKWFKVPETEPIRKVKIPSDILGISSDADYFFIKTKGNTLAPIVKPNDLILVKKEKEFVEGKKYLVIQDNKPKIKIMQKVGEKKILVSTDFTFDKEQPVVVKDDTEILGVAQKIITSL